MTSPHAADQEVIASIATTVLDDSPSNNVYTAADNTAIDAKIAKIAKIATKNNVNVRIMENNSNSPSPNGLASIEQLQIATTATPPPNTDATTDIPRTPPAQIKKEITVNEPAIPETLDMEDDAENYPQMTMAQQQQLDNMLAYQCAPGSHDLTMDAAALANMSSNAIGYGDDMMMAHYDHKPLYQQPPDETRISAYALLEFEDGQFYMNTYQVILGRDLAAAKAAMRRDTELERIKLEEEAGEGVSQTPVRVKREGSKSRHARSVISESAGILREGSDSDSDSRARRKKKASKKTKSGGSMSQKVSRRPSLVQPLEKINYQPQQPTRRKGPETQGAVPVDPSILRPSPHDCPLVGIHPPASTPASGYKAISRQHVKIFYNAKKSLFEAEIIGRNGAFVDDVFYYYQDIIPLKSGSYLQIGGVVVRFVLPDVAIGETGAEMPMEKEGAAPERYREGDKEMSFEFETPRDAALLGDSSDEESNEADIPQPGIEHDDDDEFENLQQQGEENPVTPQNNFDDDDELSSLSDVQDEDEVNDVREETQAVQDERLSQPVRQLTLEEQQHEQQQQLLKQHQQNQQNQQQYQQAQPQHQPQEQQQHRTGLPDFQFPMPQKKRGPGRPPKNGIMSKREQQLAKKEAQQRAMMEEQMVNGQPGMQMGMGMGMGMDMGQSISGKNKVGRPRKNPLEESPVKTEKRKYTKRKPKDPEAPGFPQHGSGDEAYNKQNKEKKSTKPPRSPSPTFNEADLTPEQLAKPQANYVTLIHEALSNSPTGQMSLPQIYRAIQRRYPFFVLKCNTNGWQSSVRHNLSQHHAFRKVERDGKGWMWAIVDGVSIEKEKKRRPTPPLHQLPPHLQHQPIYRAGPPPPGYMPQGMMPPPGYMMPPHMRPGQPPYMGQPMYAMPPGAPPQMNGHPPPGYPPVMSTAQPLAPATGTYSSPYAPKPPQGPLPPQQQPQTPMMQQHGPPPPQQNPYQQQPRPIQQAPPVNHDAKRQQAIDNFRVALVNNMKAKTSKADAIVASAINRATGLSTQSNISSSLAEHKMEDQIITALRQLLAKFPSAQQQPQYPPQGGPPPPMPQHMQPPPHQGQAPYPPPQPQHMQQPVQQPLQQNVPPQGYQQPSQPPPQQSNEAPRQPLAIISPQTAAPQKTQAEAPKPSVQRPSFSGQSQNRPAGPSVPRPPMVTPGMSRTASGSGSANQTRHGSMSASPATGIATPIMNLALQGAVNAGQQTNTPTSSNPAQPLQQTTSNGAVHNISGGVTQGVQIGGQRQSLPRQPAPQQPVAVPQQAPPPAPVQQASETQTPKLSVETPPLSQQLPQPMQPLQAPVPEPLTPINGRSPSASVAPQPQPAQEHGQTAPTTTAAAALSSAEKNENGKRPHDEDMKSGVGEPEFKRINASGPQALKA